MKSNLTYFILGIIIASVVASVFWVWLVPEKVIEVEVEKIVEVEKEVLVRIEDYTFCDKLGGNADLLQPNGYWVEQRFSCWKLETPIEEYCKENPEYCGRNR